MTKWNFPSRNNGPVEGYTNPGLAWFKGEPLKALAREICQNSLDACDDENEPVKVEFIREKIRTSDFPGTDGLYDILEKCKDYWKNQKNENLDTFLRNASRVLREEHLFVLRVSDYNTIGLQGAFDENNITPWVGLVKSTGVNVKSDATAAGSYGIGKAAAFVNSNLQTVFYRTKDLEGKEAAQGVANLMAFLDEESEDEDKVRRSTGFYGNPQRNLPVEKLPQLDAINKRTEVGTDIFIPGFKWATSTGAKWTEIMIGEILENFLMSISYGKLKVQIENETIDKESLRYIVARYSKYAKNAYCFNRILMENPQNVIVEELTFHGMGTIKLRLLYANDLNKKILVVRKSGMKIADIKGLPTGISYTGILELKGDGLNSFFREMENPKHDNWEPERHNNPDLAKKYKKEVENWVKETILKKVEELSGEESSVDMGDCFNTATSQAGEGKHEKQEKLTDTTKSIEITIRNTKTQKNRTSNNSGKNKLTGNVDDGGELSGHRHRTGIAGGKPTGRKGRADDDGKDTVFSGMKLAKVSARVITQSNDIYRLVISSNNENLSHAEVEVFSVGENGKTIPVHISGLVNADASISNGRISIQNLMAGKKQVLDFRITGKQKYAMGVKVYGN